MYFNKSFQIRDFLHTFFRLRLLPLFFQNRYFLCGSVPLWFVNTFFNFFLDEPFSFIHFTFTLHGDRPGLKYFLNTFASSWNFSAHIQSNSGS